MDASPSGSPPAELPNMLDVPIEDRDRVWFETYYQGDSQPQLTVRAVVMGMFLGAIMSLSNIYVGLKTGWGLGVAITACILSYAIWTALLKARIAKTPMSILENNCMQSTASSAGFSTGGTMISAVAAYLLITGKNLPWPVLTAWTAFLALLGVSIAVPMKRQMINREQLMFPSGIAAAETLKSLHAAGGEALKKARSLFWALLGGGVVSWFLDGNAPLMSKLAAKFKLPAVLGKIGLPHDYQFLGERLGKKFGLLFPGDPLLMAAGAIVGMRTSLSMVGGAIFVFGIMGPWLESHGVFTEMHQLGAIGAAVASPGNVRKWSLWTGSSLMVAGGLTSFVFQWKSIVRALSSMGALFSRSTTAADDPLQAIEVPNSWFAAGTTVSGIGCVVIMQMQWGVAWYWGVVAVGFAFVLSLVASRATGETDTTPIGAMGKVTQLFYGITIRGNPVANLMTAGVTAGAAGASADLLTDLKSGYLLGANPRKQFLAQALGIIGGTAVVVPAWYLLVPDASKIGADSKMFPAPAAEVWASVSRLLARGLESLHPTILKGMIAGAALGILLTVAENLAPPRIRKWLPSPTGVGLAFVINFADSLAFLVGAVAAWLFQKFNRKAADMYIVPVASGVIAGESVMGIAITLLGAAGVL